MVEEEEKFQWKKKKRREHQTIKTCYKWLNAVCGIWDKWISARENGHVNQRRGLEHTDKTIAHSAAWLIVMDSQAKRS